jgi:hypothetical protein
LVFLLVLLVVLMQLDAVLDVLHCFDWLGGSSCWSQCLACGAFVFDAFVVHGTIGPFSPIDDPSDDFFDIEGVPKRIDCFDVPFASFRDMIGHAVSFELATEIAFEEWFLWTWMFD